MSIKLTLAAIHNQEEDRVSDLLDSCNIISEFLKKHGVHTSIIEIYKQPTLSTYKLNLFQWFFYRVNTLLTVASWEIYMKRSSGRKERIHHTLSAIYIPVKEAIVGLFCSDYRHKITEEKVKELFLWKKHNKAQEYALSQNSNLLLALESDAKLIQANPSRLNYLLKLIRETSLADSALYVQVGQGFPLDQNMGSLTETTDEWASNLDAVTFDRATTNTTSGYLVNSRFLEELANFELYRNINQPFYSVPLTADWYLNSFFMWFTRRYYFNILVLHLNSPIFSHGSLNGELASTFSFH